MEPKLIGTVMFICWWFPIGLYNNTSLTSTTDSRATLAFLFVVAYMIYVSTFAALMSTGLESSDTAANIGNLLGFLMLLFCGILAAPRALPGFWMFMYRVNPFTYLTEGLLGAGLSRAEAHCAQNEWLEFTPPMNVSCGQYMAEYISHAGGELMDAATSTLCRFCPITETDQFLAAVGVRYSHRWRNLGIFASFIIFNCFGAAIIYWVVRVPKGKGTKRPEIQGQIGQGTLPKSTA
jgi:ATP-binding cassette, subfamily G (WHITE), member 2, PDR